MKIVFDEIYYEGKTTGEYEGNEYVHQKFIDRSSGENVPMKFTAGNDETKNIKLPPMVPLSGMIECEMKGGGKYPVRFIALKIDLKGGK